MTSTAVLMASLRAAAIAPLGLVRRQAIFRRRKPRGVGKSAASSPAGRSRVAHNGGAHEKNRVSGLPNGSARLLQPGRVQLCVDGTLVGHQCGVGASLYYSACVYYQYLVC